jgi:hypothetical protein
MHYGKAAMILLDTGAMIIDRKMKGALPDRQHPVLV